MKEKFIKSTIILIIGGLLTKILGMLIRVMTTRIVGVTGIGLYMLVMPTYGLFITVATLSLPIAISKLVSENKRNNKNVVLGIIPIALLFNILIISILLLSSKFIANNLLQNTNLYYPIIAISITLPFITLSSIIRGYFFGKQNMVPNSVPEKKDSYTDIDLWNKLNKNNSSNNQQQREQAGQQFERELDKKYGLNENYATQNRPVQSPNFSNQNLGRNAEQNRGINNSRIKVDDPEIPPFLRRKFNK